MISRFPLSIRFASSLAVAFVGASAQAIVDTNSSTTPLGADSSFNYVAEGGGSSFVAVGSHAFLTAGHVLGGGVTSGSLNVLGNTYHVSNTIAAPDYVIPSGPNAGSYHVDLTLVIVQEALPFFYSIPNALPTLGSTATLVGFGGTGVVNGTGTGYTITDTDRHTRRAGSGRLDGSFFFPLPSSTPSATGAGGGPLVYSALLGAGDAQTVPGDSGGGFFVNNQLVGILSAQFTTNGFNGDAYTFANSTGMAVAAAVDLTDPQIQRWLISQGVNPVPEPATMAALGVGALALLRRRRK